MACAGVGAAAANQLMKVPQKHLLIMLLTAMCGIPFCLFSKHSQGVDALSWKPKNIVCKTEQNGLVLQVDMYADPGGRGGVLEPEGIVEIKFRLPELHAAMARLDPVLQALRAESGSGSEAAIAARQAALLPVYRQVWPSPAG